MARCSIQSCPGALETRPVTHTVRLKGELIVIEGVPAEVCPVCGDTLFTPETVERIQAILASPPKPSRSVPLYDYAANPASSGAA